MTDDGFTPEGLRIRRATLMVHGGDLPGHRGQVFAPLSGATG
jgi:hypothetical protein